MTGTSKTKNVPYYEGKKEKKRKTKIRHDKTTKPSVLYILTTQERVKQYLVKREVNRGNFRAPLLSYDFSRSTLHIKKENEYKLF